MDFYLWIALGGLALSGYLAYLESRRRRRKLHFSVTSMKLIDGLNNELFVVLYLSFVNSSTIPKSLYRMDFEPLEKYQIHEVNGVSHFESSVMEYKPFGIAHKGCVLPFDDIPPFPLDVEPLHSKTVALPVLISPIQFERYEDSKDSNQLLGHFAVFDQNNHLIAKAPLEFPV